jgi:hypothetical protein
MSITTTIKVGETGKTITLPEGKALTIKPTVGSIGTAGVAYLLDQALGGNNSKGSWQIGSAALAPIGPYEGTQKILITCTAGSIDATVGDAVVGAAQLERDAATNEIGLAGPATDNAIEEAFRLAFSQIVPKTTPTVVETVPTLAMTGTRYYIDPIAGNNSLAGTSKATAWASITKLISLNPGAGAVIHLADDSISDFADTFAVYKARTTFPYNGIDNFRGTAAQPIIIKPYTARPGSTQKRPIIRYYGVLATSDWTQETGIGPNVWSAPFTGTFANDVSSRMLFGPNKVLGVAPRQQVVGQAYGNTPQQLAKDRDFAFDGTKLYVYSSGGNPTTYYNGVYLAGQPVFSSSWEGGHHTKWVGLRFEYCNGFILEYSSTNANSVQGFEISDCVFYRCNPGYFANKATAGSASEMVVTFKNLRLIETPSSGIRLGSTTGTAGNTMSWEVLKVRVYGGNYCSSVGGALLYNQAKGGTKHIVWGCYGYDCRNGTGGNNIDGAFVYHDVSSRDNITAFNIAERCGVPFQLNNSVNSTMVANATIDCIGLAQITGAPDVNTPNQSYICAHNTWLWTGRVNSADIPIGPSAPKFATGAVITEFNDQVGAFGSGNKFTNLVIANNLAVSADPASANKPMLSYILSQVTTALIAGNAAAGLGAVLAKDNGVDSTATGNVIALAASLADIETWLPNARTGNARPAKDTPLAGIGAALSIQYQDIAGKNFAARPTPGCYETLV